MSSHARRVKNSLWVLFSFIPIFNGLGFVYIGNKTSNHKLFVSGLIYEMPWVLYNLTYTNMSIANIFIFLSVLSMFISLIHGIIVVLSNDEIYDSKYDFSDVEKPFTSLWIIFSFILFLNGFGFIYLFLKTKKKELLYEGLFYEVAWVLYMMLFSLPFIGNFALFLALLIHLISIIRSFMVHFDLLREYKSKGESLSKRMNSKTQKSTVELEKTNENIVWEKKIDEKADENIIKERKIDENTIDPSFKPYIIEINELNKQYGLKSKNLSELINKRFSSSDITYERFMNVLKSSNTIFEKESTAAVDIIRLSGHSSPNILKAVEEKTNVLKSIIAKVDELTEELILKSAGNEKDEQDLKGLVEDMEDLIDSVKDYY